MKLVTIIDWCLSNCDYVMVIFWEINWVMSRPLYREETKPISSTNNWGGYITSSNDQNA